MKTLLLATRNAGKVKEIRSIISDVRVELISLLDIPELPDIEEDGTTIEENARKKARHVFDATGLPVLSDDTGLEVFSLGMKPGVYSARYAGEKVSYEENYTKLLRELQGVSAKGRGAQFRCVTVFMAPGVTQQAEGTCHGYITDEPRGAGGFGYDPVFIPDGFNLTFAELPEEVKNRISHRGRALMQLKKFLFTYFS